MSRTWSFSAFLTDEDGQPVDMDALYPGTYRLCYGLADKNGNLTNSKLLGETHYSVRYDINGEEQTLESDESGWVEVTLGSSDHLNADLSATYLNGYRIEKDNAGLGWPLDGLTPTAHPTSRIELKLEAPQTYVVRSQLEEAQPLTATLLLDGQPMPAELLAQTEVTVDGELDCTVTPNGDGTYTIRLSPEQSAADGLRRITVQASGTDEYGEPYQITAEHKLEAGQVPTVGTHRRHCADRPAAADAVPAVHGDEGAAQEDPGIQDQLHRGKLRRCPVRPARSSPAAARRRDASPSHPQVYGQSSGQVRHGAGAGGGGQPLDPSR